MGSIFLFFAFWSPCANRSAQLHRKQSNKIGSKLNFFIIWSPFLAKAAHFIAKKTFSLRHRRLITYGLRRNESYSAKR